MFLIELKKSFIFKSHKENDNINVSCRPENISFLVVKPGYLEN